MCIVYWSEHTIAQSCPDRYYITVFVLERAIRVRPFTTMAQAVRVFFDISIGADNAGRVVFELYPGIAPKTVENFRALW